MGPAFLCFPHPSTSIHGPRVPLLSPSFFGRAHLTIAHRVLCAGASFPCSPVPSHTNTWGVHQQGDWLEPLPAAAPPKPSLPPASHPSPICFSLRPQTGSVAPEHSHSQPASTRYPRHCPASLPAMTDANLSGTLTDMFPVCFSKLKRSPGLLCPQAWKQAWPPGRLPSS